MSLTPKEAEGAVGGAGVWCVMATASEGSEEGFPTWKCPIKIYPRTVTLQQAGFNVFALLRASGPQL